MSTTFQIYRFEVLNEVSRAGANVVYEARDPLEDMTLRLYEWTPVARDAAEVRDRFASAVGETEGVEAFTSGSRLYLAASDSKARAGLEVLRDHELFSGPWPGMFEDSSPIMADPIAPLSLPGNSPEQASSAADTARSRNGFLIASTVVLSILCLALVIYISIVGSERDRANSNFASTRDYLNSQVNDLNNKINALQEQLKSERERHYQQTIDGFFAAEKALSDAQPGGVYLVSILNDCSESKMFVALRYQSLRGDWATTGWWSAEYGKSIQPRAVYSRNSNFYFYAEDANGRPIGANDSVAVNADVVSERFLHLDGQDFDGPDKRTVAMIHEQATDYNWTKHFGCSN